VVESFSSFPYKALFNNVFFFQIPAGMLNSKFNQNHKPEQILGPRPFI